MIDRPTDEEAGDRMTDNNRTRHRQGAVVIKDGVPYANTESTLSLLPGAAVGEFLSAHRNLIDGTLLDAGAGNQPYAEWYAPLVKRAVSVDAAPTSPLPTSVMNDSAAMTTRPPSRMPSRMPSRTSRPAGSRGPGSSATVARLTGMRL